MSNSLTCRQNRKFMVVVNCDSLIKLRYVGWFNIFSMENSKPVERQGRKVTGLRSPDGSMTAGLPDRHTPQWVP